MNEPPFNCVNFSKGKSSISSALYSPLLKSVHLNVMNPILDSFFMRGIAENIALVRLSLPSSRSLEKLPSLKIIDLL